MRIADAPKKTRKRPEQTGLYLPLDLRQQLDDIAAGEGTPGGRSGLIVSILREWLAARATGFHGYGSLLEALRKVAGA